jgi:hypothetical protein
MDSFWDVAHGRAKQAILGTESIVATSVQERAYRVLLALAMITPEQVLQQRLDQRAIDLAWVRPLEGRAGCARCA